MKKTLILVSLVLVVLLASCNAKGFSKDYIQACYDQGGLMGEDGCVTQSTTTQDSSEKANAESEKIENPVTKPASDCEGRMAELKAPEGITKAVCEATPKGNGVSERLPVGTQVTIGSITFNQEDRVWFLQNFTTPAKANYSFSYEGAEQALFDAGFVTGTELGYGEGDSRVQFRVCWDTTSEGCIPPADLFPAQ